MTPAMIAALQEQRASATGFFELDLPSGTRRLMLGSGEVSSGGFIFKGYDSTIGSIGSGDTVREDSSGEAPNTSLTIDIASTATRADIASGTVQLSPVRISLAALELDGSDHLIAIPDPELLFNGFIDQATIGLDRQRDEVNYTIISAFDYFFEDTEGQRLSSQFHKTVWAGELGLDNVTGVSRKVYWGTYGPGSTSGVSIGIGGGSNTGACVADDTPVLLADGSVKPAGELRIGDMLRTRHEHTLAWGEFPVVAFRTELRPVFRAVIDGRELRATADHPVWIDDGWRLMENVGVADGRAIIVKLTVEEAHTFVSNGILSHNKRADYTGVL